jgi:predicted RNA-binding Zn ribbon-like protein
VLFSHDTEHALACAVDLVNSGSGDDELLPDLEALRAFVEVHDVSEVGDLTADDLRAVRALRRSLRPLFSTTDDADTARLVNALVARAAVVPRLTAHDGYDFHMHYFAPGASLAEHLAVESGIAVAQVVTTGERERLRVCDAPDCDRVLVDLSRNRSKRYCDARTCGNRLHVAAYRERQRASGA